MMEAENDMPELPSNWVWTNLGDISEEVVKISPKDDPEKGFLYIDISSIDNRNQRIISHKKYLGKDAPSRARQLIKTGDILFSTVRTYLKNIAMVGEIYNGQIASTGFCVIRPNRLINSKLIFYYSQTDSFLNSLNPKQRGTSYPAVRNFDVFSQPFPLAPPHEQHRIVAKIEELFSGLDAGVEALQKAKAQLRRYRQAVLKAAVEGRLTAKWRATHKNELESIDVLIKKIEEERKSLSIRKRPQLESLSPEKLSDIPEQWTWKRLGAIALIADVDHKMPKGKDSGFYLISPKDFIEPDGICFENAKKISTEDFEKLSRKCMPEFGDMIYSRYGTIGRVRKVPKDIKFQISYSLCLIRPVPSLKNNDFLYWFLKSSSVFKQAIAGIKSTAIPDLGLKDINNFLVPIPPPLEQNMIVEEIDKCLSIADEIERVVELNIKYANRLRQSILKLAFEGKLVPHNPNDERASILLDRIKYERSIHAPKKGRRINSNTTHQMRLIR